MSELLVAKAGGTSHADAEAVLQSMKWAEQADIFVCSAPGKLDGSDPISNKVTNMSLSARKHYRNEGEIPSETIDMITERYSSIVSGLGGLAHMPRRWVDKISPRFEEAVRQGYHSTFMFGEQLMAEIYEGCGFTMLNVSRAPHDLGTDPETWRSWLGKEFEYGNKYVLPGNTTRVNGHLETFSRGGSDISGGLAAYGIGANLNLNLTDSCAKSADPRLFTASETKSTLRNLTHLLYEEARELGSNGTVLLHRTAMVPLMLGEIPTEIRGTSDPESHSTLLDNDKKRAEDRIGSIVALSLMKNVTIQRVHEPGMAEGVGRLAAFETALAFNDISLIDSQGDGVDSQKYYFETKDAEKAAIVLGEVTNRGMIETSGNLSFITLVGHRLDSNIPKNIMNITKSARVNGDDWRSHEHDLTIGRNSIRISVNPNDALGILDGLHYSLIENK